MQSKISVQQPLHGNFDCKSNLIISQRKQDFKCSEYFKSGQSELMFELKTHQSKLNFVLTHQNSKLCL